MATPEGKVKSQLREIFKKYNVLYTPVTQTLYGNSGFPDYQAYTRAGKGFVVEVKSATGKLTPNQLVWRKDLLEWGVPYFLFNGSEKSVNELEEFLR